MSVAISPVHPVWWLAPRPGAIVAVEVFVEDVILPKSIGLAPIGAFLSLAPTVSFDSCWSISRKLRSGH
jgi:hypothetical protein